MMQTTLHLNVTTCCHVWLFTVHLLCTTSVLFVFCHVGLSCSLSFSALFFCFYLFSIMLFLTCYHFICLFCFYLLYVVFIVSFCYHIFAPIVFYYHPCATYCISWVRDSKSRVQDNNLHSRESK